MSTQTIRQAPDILGQRPWACAGFPLRHTGLFCLDIHLNSTSSRSDSIQTPFLTVTPKFAVDRQVRSGILGWISAARVSLSRFTKMAKKPNRKHASPEPAQAEERIKAIKTEIAQAMIERNTLPNTASDEEKATAAARVEQLQAQHHEAVQHLLAIKREETTKLEREHKEKKLRHKRLRASRQPGGHAAPHEEPAPQRHSSVHPPMDRAAEEAQMDAFTEEDLFLQRQELEEEDGESADELAHRRSMAEKKRKKEEAAKLREAEKREKHEAEAKAEAARLKVEKEARAKIRQQAALQRAEETKAKKRQQRAEREARRRAAQDARSSGWFSEVLRQLKTFFGGPR
ncbi:MAG: hypothetical protein ACYTFA_09570 [Planctomycetota bacterium]|jgi:hypothetical protein